MTGFTGSTGPSAALSAWVLEGNTGTISGPNFIGTRDDQPFLIATNGNTGAGTRFTQKGQIEILGTGQSVFLGEGAGAGDTGSNNTYIGYHAGFTGTTGEYNVGLGSGALANLESGSFNIALGANSGSNYSFNESNNILIGNSGETGDSGIIRFGTPGVQVKNFQAGIFGITTDNNDALMVVIDSEGQLGTTLNIQPYAVYSDSTIQKVSSTTTAQLVTFDTNVIETNISHTVGTSVITINVNGVYLFTFVAKLYGAAADIDMWMRKNGVDVADTNNHITLQNSNDWKILTVSYINTAVTNDYFELVQSSTDINAGLVSIGAQTSPTRPASTSITLTINKISN